jgi:hypothetical protein
MPFPFNDSTVIYMVVEKFRGIIQVIRVQEVHLKQSIDTDKIGVASESGKALVG